MKIFCLVGWCLVWTGVQATVGPIVKDDKAVETSEFIDQEDLKKHLEVLASDEYEGRETGKEGQRMAAEYLAKTFAQLKLPKIKIGEDSSYFQNYELQEEQWDEVNITANGKTYEFLKDFYCFHGLNKAGELDAKEVVFLGFGIEDDAYNDYTEQDVKDKILVVFANEPINKKGKSHLTNDGSLSLWSYDWTIKMRTAKAHGAKAIFIVQENIDSRINRWKHRIEKPSLRLMGEEDHSEAYARSFYISEAMATDLFNLAEKDLNKIRNRMNKKGKPMSFPITTDVNISVKKKVQTIVASNVLGFIEGSQKKDEVIVITAHYDHIGVNDEGVFNGADDDGSGTVAILELAEAFTKAKEAGYGPKRSILFMPVSGEEKGLLGSEYYTDHPVFPLENTVANLNIDMIGRIDDTHKDDSNYVYIIGSDFLSKGLHEVSEKANEVYMNMKLDYSFNTKDDPNRFYYRSDHYNFAKNNVPVVFYFNGTHADYHKSTDTIEKISFTMLQQRTKLIFFTAWHLANLEERIHVDEPED